MLKKNQFPIVDHGGISQCARYAFMPNRLSFCGPNKNQDLFYYSQNQHKEKKADLGLSLILKEFQTLYPYLKFIASSNRIKDIFDRRVVEAYWIGNELLENISKFRLYYHLTENLKLKKKFNKKDFEEVSNRITLGAKPHHSFHVLSIWKQKKNLDTPHVLSSMDLCRISWGKIKKINQSDIRVRYCPLALRGDTLKLGSPVTQKILHKIDDRSFVDGLQVGQWVSFHWGFVCEILNKNQINNLKKYTEESIQLVNST